ncbi:hypothetical protein D3C81_2291080 [compost metagenome]
MGGPEPWGNGRYAGDRPGVVAAPVLLVIGQGLQGFVTQGLGEDFRQGALGGLVVRRQVAVGQEGVDDADLAIGR